MGRYLYPELTGDLAAVVSTHGYFEIQKRESYNSYAAAVIPKSGVWRHNDDGTRTRCPVPVVVYEGDVEDLGLRYVPEHDDLAEEDDDAEVIRTALLRYVSQRSN